MAIKQINDKLKYLKSNLGPQISYKEYLNEEEIKLTKSILNFNNLNEENSFNNLIFNLIQNCCKSFEKNHGTGTSSLLTYIRLLLEYYNSLLSINMNMNIINDSLDLIEEIYIKCCYSLLIVSNPFNRLELENPNSFSTPIIPNSSQLPIPDEFSWFFDDIDNNNNNNNENEMNLKQIDHQLYCGLQHSLWWDYPIQEQTPSFEMDCNCCKYLSLPILLTREIYHSFTSIPLSEYIFSKIKLTYFQSRKWVKNLVSIHCIQGCNLTDSKVYPNSIALFMEKYPHLTNDSNFHQNNKNNPNTSLSSSTSIDNNLTNVSIRVLYNCKNSYKYHQMKILRVLLIQNIIVINKTNDEYDGQGASNQALETQNEIRYIYNITSKSTSQSSTNSHSTSSIISKLNHSNSYLQRILKKLIQHKIQMILCPEPISLELLDLCTEHHIILLPCHPSQLMKFSHLTQVYILDDILDLTDDFYQNNNNNDNNNITSNYFVEIQINDMVRYIDNSDGVQEGMILYSQQESIMFLLTVHQNYNENINSNKVLFPSFQPHTTVILSCPTGILGYQLYFRILRCLSRLSHLTSSYDNYNGNLLSILSSSSSTTSSSTLSLDVTPQLVCGGGLVELLCSIEIENIIKSSSYLLNYSNITSRLSNESITDLRFIFTRLQYLFQEFVQIINENNGINEKESINNWNESLLNIQSLVTTDTLENIKELSSERKWKLVTPVQLFKDNNNNSNENHVVLDILSIKIDMIKMAIYTVKLILQSQVINY